jgi:uncharacterized protein
MLNPPISFEEARVLGCLIEKDLTTPDHYPLTTGALVAACNQLSNREPVVEWDEKAVEAAAGELRRRGLAAMVHMAGARVPKFKHQMAEYFPTLDQGARALLAVLLLRGPQTAAELRARTERMARYADIAGVEAALAALVAFGEGPLVAVFPPGGGRRATTYAQLLTGAEAARAFTTPPAAPAAVIPPPPDRLADLEDEIGRLRGLVEALAARLAAIEHDLGIGPPNT